MHIVDYYGTCTVMLHMHNICELHHQLVVSWLLYAHNMYIMHMYVYIRIRL